jgi:hypothetical protein
MRVSKPFTREDDGRGREDSSALGREREFRENSAKTKEGSEGR